jgi:hypothetical protein
VVYARLSGICILFGLHICMYYVVHTYNSRLILEGGAEASQIFLRDAHALPKLLSYEDYYRCDRWLSHRRPIAVYLVFYDIHERKILYSAIWFWTPRETRNMYYVNMFKN